MEVVTFQTSFARVRFNVELGKAIPNANQSNDRTHSHFMMIDWVRSARKSEHSESGQPNLSLPDQSSLRPRSFDWRA